MKLVPRTYQKPAINKVVAAIREFGQALMVMATGMGKTLTSAWVAKKLNVWPVLFVIHNQDILERAMEDYRKIFPRARFGIFTGTEKNFKDCDVVFAMVQLLHRNLHLFRPHHFKLIVCDEGHHYQAVTFKKIVEYFRCPRLGMTGWPDRMDMKDIRQLFGKEVVNISLEKAIAKGWLPKVEYHLVTDTLLNEEYLHQLAEDVLKKDKKVSLKQIKKRLFVRTREEKIVRIIEADDRTSIVFCHGVSHANHIASLFHSAATYHSGNKRAVNKQALRNLEEGQVRRICTVDAFNEGIHIPVVEEIDFIRTTESESVFRQQLGRGMDQNLPLLVVRDFAGNIERLRMIKQMVDTIARIHEEETSETDRKKEGYLRNSFIVSGHGFEFTFSEQVVSILEIFDRLQTPPYPTWQEASVSAMKLGCKFISNYEANYRMDPRLPSAPERLYPDFPGYPTFLRGKEKPYSDCKEASKGAKKLGFKTRKQYITNYKTDPRLPSDPSLHYKGRGWPGWNIFLQDKEARKFYPDCKSAMRAVQALKIKTKNDYKAKYTLDPLLPSTPNQIYSKKGWPGWYEFLGKQKKYPTWQESSQAVGRLGIKTIPDYKKKRVCDTRLPANPYQSYPDFPGWPIFLGRQN